MAVLMQTHIVFVLFDNVTQLDFTGPAQVLSKLPNASVHVAAAQMQPIATDVGFGIMPTTRFAECPQADILCVPGGHGVRDVVNDHALVEFVRQQSNGARYVTSVCTGAFILGTAGLLVGKRATCHWAYTHLLERVGAEWQPGRVVRDGNVFTAGGVTSGIDFALTLVSEIAGEDVARTIQLAIEYDPNPPFRSGNPNDANVETVQKLKQQVYDKAAAALDEALAKAMS
jgi:cyclohexyl-isocyanide hydratase